MESAVTMRRLGSVLAVIAMVLAVTPALAFAQTTPAPVAPPPLAPGIIAPGVSIAGIPVAGLNAADATRAVIAQYVAPRRQPLLVTFRGRNLSIDPVKVGYVADVDYAVKVALIYGRTQPVPATGRRRARSSSGSTAPSCWRPCSCAPTGTRIPARDAALTLKGVKPVVAQGARRDHHRRRQVGDHRRATRSSPATARATPSRRSGSSPRSPAPVRS